MMWWIGQNSVQMIYLVPNEFDNVILDKSLNKKSGHSLHPQHANSF